MRLLLLVVSISAGITWGVFCWRASRAPETFAASRWRTAAFAVMIAAGSFVPSRRQNPEEPEQF